MLYINSGETGPISFSQYGTCAILKHLCGHCKQDLIQHSLKSTMCFCLYSLWLEMFSPFCSPLLIFLTVVFAPQAHEGFGD